MQGKGEGEDEQKLAAEEEEEEEEEAKKKKKTPSPLTAAPVCSESPACPPAATTGYHPSHPNP
jgi:hypothetical protein